MIFLSCIKLIFSSYQAFWLQHSEKWINIFHIEHFCGRYLIYGKQWTVSCRKLINAFNFFSIQFKSKFTESTSERIKWPAALLLPDRSTYIFEFLFSFVDHFHQFFLFGARKRFCEWTVFRIRFVVFRTDASSTWKKIWNSLESNRWVLWRILYYFDRLDRIDCPVHQEPLARTTLTFVMEYFLCCRPMWKPMIVRRYRHLASMHRLHRLMFQCQCSCHFVMQLDWGLVSRISGVAPIYAIPLRSLHSLWNRFYRELK